MDPHRADDVLGRDRDRRHRHDRDRDGIESVAIVGLENPLFLAEDQAAQGRGVAQFPGPIRELNAKLACQKGLEGQDHARLS